MDQKINFLQGEQVIKRSDNDVLSLTNMRVRYDSIAWGRSIMISVTLESVSSCGLVTRSNPFLLVTAVISLHGAFSQQGSLSVILYLATGILVAAYFLTRKTVISIRANSGEGIYVPTEGVKRADAIGFLDSVGREKMRQLTG